MRRFVPVKKLLIARRHYWSKRESEIAYPVKFYVIHANNLAVGKRKLQKKYPDAEIEVGHFGPVIGSIWVKKRIGIAIAAQ